MYTLFGIIIVIIILLIIAGIYSALKTKLSFIILGLDSGFSFADTLLLWNVAQICHLDQPTSLFFSLNSLSRCLNHISNQASADGVTDTTKMQQLLTKLFNFRTKLQNESDDKKGLVTTQSLDKGQKFRIILPGKGVFYSEILNNAGSIVISIPKQKELIPIPAHQWVGKTVSVYFWRKGDAAYVFDSKITQHGMFMGKPSLSLQHSANLTRTQKRKAVRAKCEIYGTLFIIKNNTIDVSAIETQNGYRCLIEDISESGAMIKIGGKGMQNVKIKLQFNLQSKLIVMYGVIRKVGYNEAQNISHLHFECTQIDPVMRNDVLSYVYNILPENEKEIIDAISQAQIDENEELEDEAASTASPASSEEAEQDSEIKAAMKAANTVAATNVPNASPKAEKKLVIEDQINIF